MKAYLVMLIGILYLWPPAVQAQIVVPRKDSLPFQELPTLTVTAKRTQWTQREQPFTREETARILRQLGVSFIQRGSPLGQDVYLNGFKRGEVELLIDGERYSNSCPNRMDPPLLRVNPLDMQSVEVQTSSSALQAELGGAITFHRRPLHQRPRLRGIVTLSRGANPMTDIALSVDGWHHRVTGRIFRGESYRDGEGKSFKDRYGYRKASISYRLLEASLQGRQHAFSYGVHLNTATDVPYPYLLMDERTNVLTGGFLRYQGHKLYANYTHHLMDNALRQNPMFMETDAHNVVLGVTDQAHYELFYRFWKARNTMKMGQMTMQQAMIPGIRVLSLQLFHSLSWNRIALYGKLGLRRYSIDEKERPPLYATFYPEAKKYRWFPIWVLSLTRTWHVSSLALGITGEVGSTPPVPEELYLGLKRPQGKPWRLGNPTLKAPIRTSLHMTIHHANFQLTTSTSFIARYSYLAMLSRETVKAVTYRNIRAFIASVEAQGHYRFLRGTIQYTHGENLTDNLPLAEMLPLTVNIRLSSPETYALHGYLEGLYTARQTRVDETLGEESTPSYYQINVGLSYRSGKQMTWILEVENLTNHTYYTPLSYLRDPFRSGFSVYEPGRTVTFRVQWDI